MEHLIIPTLGRIDRQRTYNNLPQKYKDITQFVVQDHEYDVMNERYPGKVLRLPKEIKKLSPTRQWIWDEFYGTRHMVLDDDFDHFKNKTPAEFMPEVKVDTKWISTNMTDEEFDDAFDTFNRWCDEEGIYHGGFSTSWTVPDARWWPHQDNVRIATNCYFDSKNLPRDIIWDRLETSQDFDANLQLLTRGYPNRVNTKYRVTVGGTNIKGGCSTYRTTETMTRVHKQLAELYPDFVSLKVKKPKSGPLQGQEYIACHIQWRKAYEESKRKREQVTIEDFFG